MAFAPSEHDIASRLAPSAAERSASRRGRGRQGCSLLPSSRCIYLRGLRLLSPFWRRSAMQAGRYLGSEEGILGSCSVVQKIMSVPCGAVSGDRSQMQSLLYGRLSFSAENSLPPSQTSSKTFSRYCGSLRLKRGEKGGKKGFSSLLPLSSSRRISLGCAGVMPCPRAPGGPLTLVLLRTRRRTRGPWSRQHVVRRMAWVSVHDKGMKHIHPRGGAGRLGELLWPGHGGASVGAGHPLVTLLPFPASEFRTFWGNLKKKGKKKGGSPSPELRGRTGRGVCGGRGQQPRGWDPLSSQEPPLPWVLR
ncbi:uncharacterized protein LOC121672853 [Corvus kubaryi]|uniref:uncharacterized protein LOC121672853 n=1 Tax=Corvus kubaryi TaxID=68294 RepID=UPI001C056A6A|nr:uncharacterized protein LOC121672853 [Corvus kubaryi]